MIKDQLTKPGLASCWICPMIYLHETQDISASPPSKICITRHSKIKKNTSFCVHICIGCHYYICGKCPHKSQIVSVQMKAAKATITKCWLLFLLENSYISWFYVQYSVQCILKELSSTDIFIILLFVAKIGAPIASTWKFCIDWKKNDRRWNLQR